MQVSVNDIRKLAQLQNHCYAIIHNTLTEAQAESGIDLTAAMEDSNSRFSFTYVMSLLLFYAIASVFQLYHGGMMYEMRSRNP